METNLISKIMGQPKAQTNQAPISITPDGIRYAISNPEVKETVSKIRSLIAAGVDSGSKEITELKKTLPMLICAQGLKDPARGRRKDNVIGVDIFCLDLDYLKKDPRQIYTNIIAPRIKELHIGMVQVTAKGQGLHIWAQREANESIADAIQRVSGKLGLSEYADTSCSDASHGMFLTTTEDLLCINDDFFFFHSTEEAQAAAKMYDITNNTKKNYTINNSNNMTINYSNQNQAGCGSLAYQAPAQPVQTEYQGAKLTEIVDEYIRLAMPNGIREGDRNKNMYRIYVNLLQICDTTAAIEATKHVTKNIPEDDVYGPLKSAYSKIAAGEGYKSKDFTLAINNCTMASAFEKGEEELYMEEPNKLPAYPLPELLQATTANLPQELVVPALMAANPIIGSILSGVKFSYWFDGEDHHFSFLTLVLASQSSCKTSGIYPRMLTLAKVLFDEDAQAEEAWDWYYDAVAKTKPGEPKPVKPAESQRISPVDITSASFLDFMNCTNGKTALLMDDEANSFFKTGGGPEYRMTKEIIKKSYDQQTYKMRRKESKFTGPIALNIFLLSTYGVLSNFDNVEEGDVSRYTFATIPELPFHQPRRSGLSNDQIQTIAKITTGLTHQEGYRYAHWIDAAAEAWRDEMEDKILATGSNALKLLYRRAVVNLTRIAYMLAILYGCIQTSPDEQPRPEDEEKRQATLAWAKYLADYSLQQTLRYFGDAFEKCDTGIPVASPVLPDLYEPLGDTFTTQDVKDITTKLNHFKGNASKVIKMWITNKWVERMKDASGRILNGQFRKIPRTKWK